MSDRVVRGRKYSIAVASAGVGLLCAPAWATDIFGVLPAALDQPRVYAVIRPGTGANPYVYEDYDPFTNQTTKGFNIDPAYLDTGASGVLLSGDVSALLQNTSNGTTGMPTQMYNGKQVYYEDVGVVGSDRFKVTAPFSISIAPFHPNTEQQIADAQDAYTTTNSFSGIDLSFYNHTVNNVRATMSEHEDPNNPSATGPLNVLGVPVMKGKVVVMDNRPVNTFFDTMRTYLYNKGTPANPAQRDSDPGVVQTTRTVKLSYGNFDKFTETGTLDAGNNLVPLPADQLAANIPTLDHNPFIGPNPVSPAGDTTPPVKISFNNRTTTGSFLLDTGAAASMISSQLASQLAVRYRPGTKGTDNPILETYDLANPSAPGSEIQDQFKLDIGGIGGTSRAAGFFLSSLLVRTTEGNLNNDLDPKHLRFMDAPVLVNDIALKDPHSTSTLTLDGIFGMNFLVASALIEYQDLGGITVPLPVLLGQGAFDWAVFDETDGLLKLRPHVAGDANRDGKVDFADLLALAKHFNGQTDTDDPSASGDFNGDGVVNFTDLLTLAKHYGATDLLDNDVVELPQIPFDLGLSSGASAVPEPSAAGLLLGAVAAPLLARRGRRRRMP
jgi:hypothetical protein